MLPGRVVMMIALFVVLAGAGFAWAMHHSGVEMRDLLQLLALPAAVQVTLLALCLLVYFLDVWRFRVLGHAIGVVVPWRAALDAAVACFFFAWISPAATLGTPAAIYMLGRHGVPWDAATLMAFTKTFLGVSVLLAAAFLIMATGYGPTMPVVVQSVLVSGTLVVVAVMAVLTLGGLVPTRATAVLDAVVGWLSVRRPFVAPGFFRDALTAIADTCGGVIERLAHFRRAGVGGLVMIVVSNIVYFSALVGIAVVLATAFDVTSLVRVAGLATVYTAFVYLAPTPGAAGFAEATGNVFFGDVLSERNAVAFALQLRVVSFYLEMAIGFVYLLIIGGMVEIVNRSRASAATPAAGVGSEAGAGACGVAVGASASDPVGAAAAVAVAASVASSRGPRLGLVVLLLVGVTLLGAPAPAQAQVLPWPIPETAQFDVDAVDIYAEFFPSLYEADVIATVYLNYTGTGSVYLRCSGNFKWMKVSCDDQPDLGWTYTPPYFHLSNIATGSHAVTFKYRVRHDGTLHAGSVIATNRLVLDHNSYWYPRNVATDAHLVLFNLDTAPAYDVNANAEARLRRDIPNNLKRLRTWLTDAPYIHGITLAGAGNQ